MYVNGYQSVKEKFKRNGRFFVYILECRDGTYYTGYTNDLEKRITEHNDTKRGAKYLRGKKPVKLVWWKICKNQRFAMRTELTIKKLTRQDKQQLVNGSRLDNILRKYAK